MLRSPKRLSDVHENAVLAQTDVHENALLAQTNEKTEFVPPVSKNENSTLSKFLEGRCVERPVSYQVLRILKYSVIGRQFFRDCRIP